VRSVAISPDGKFIAAGIRYGTVKVWNAKGFEERLNFKAHDSDVWSVAFTPDGKTLISGDGDWNRPGQVKLWEVATGRSLAVLQTTGEVLSVAASPDGKSIAAGSWDKTVKVWDVSKLFGSAR
jgi:WD40 repeat protein